MIDLRYVKKLIEMLDASSVDSIEISSDKGMKLRIAKTPPQRGGAAIVAPMQQIPTMIAGGATVSGALGAGTPTPHDGIAAVGALTPAVAAAAVPAPAPKGVEITSPMVGTFYGAPEPGSPPYVTVGQRVAKGQVVCIIEAMKIMNEIESEHDGVVTAVLAENAHPVESGQALYRVDPNG